MRVRTSGIAAAGVLWYALVFAIVVPAVAADTSIPLRTETMWIASAPVITEPGMARMAMSESPAPASSTRMRSGDINLDFHAADITDVLKALSVQSGTNIVTGTDVKGQITVSLNHVSLPAALDMITKLSGYEYAIMGPDTYLVGSAQGLSSVLGIGQMTTENTIETVTVHYADLVSLVKTIEDLVPRVKVAIGTAAQEKAEDAQLWQVVAPGQDPKERSKPAAKTMKVLLLSGPTDQVALAKEIIKKIEQSLEQSGGTIVTEIYKVKYCDAGELGQIITIVAPTVSVTFGPTTNFQRTEGDKVQSGYTNQGTTPDISTKGETYYELKTEPELLVLTGPPADVGRAIALLEEVDRPLPQILIEAQVVDINNDATKNLGVEWAWTNFTTSGSVDILNTATNPPSADEGRSVTRSMTIGPTNLQATLNLMVESGEAKVLANPKVAMIAGKPARIFIGDEVRYISEVILGPGSSSTTTEVVAVGILLDAVGLVGPENDITLYLHPEVSTITKFIGNIPQIARRYTDSTIRVKSGQTVVIGGLIREEERVAMSKIPLLADLPFIGQLFRNKSKTRANSEVTVFLTATILGDV